MLIGVISDILGGFGLINRYCNSSVSSCWFDNSCPNKAFLIGWSFKTSIFGMSIFFILSVLTLSKSFALETGSPICVFCSSNAF